jgi:hypothetical protein
VHLVVSISGHGYGHVAQTAPVLNALHARLRDLRLTIRSHIPPEYLRTRIVPHFEYLRSEGDIGMLMSSALDVKAAASRTAYHAFHANWDKRVADEAALLRKLNADVVLSNVGYLPLAAAQHAKIPNAALCSLNWADIYGHYCGEDEVYETMRACYAEANAFIRATPGMKMGYLHNLMIVPPIAATGRNHRTELNRRLGLSANDKLVLVSMGGIDNRLPVERWPHPDNVRYLVQQSWGIRHPRAITLESLAMSFSDLLASSDVLVTKPGYGSFTEAASAGIPVLYVNRPDWPEAPYLVEWLKEHGNCREISRSALEEGHFTDALESLWRAPRKAPVKADGAEHVADWLVGL